MNLDKLKEAARKFEQREEWRRHSVLSDLAAKRVMGKGPDGYRDALEFLVRESGAKE